MKVGYILLVIGVLATSCYAQNKGEDLLKKLGVKSKNSILPPVQGGKNVTEVTFGITLQSFDLNEEDSTLVSYLWLDQSWKDERLKWDPATYDGLISMTVPVTEIWKPDIMCYNMKNTEGLAGMERFGAVVKSDGTVAWVPAYFLKSTCKTDMSRYPYDTQTCKIKFGSWTHNGDKFTLSLKKDLEGGVDISTLTENPDWSLESTSIKRNVQKYDCCPEIYYDIEVTIEIKRIATGVGFMYTAPGVFLLMLIPLFFLLPPDSSEKTIFGIGLLMTTAAIMASFPKVVRVDTSDPPIILQYYTGIIVMTAISLGITHVLAALIRMDFQCKLPAMCKKFCTCLLCAGEKMPAPEEEAGEEEGEKSGTSNSDWRLFIILLDRVFFVASVVFVIFTMLGMLA